MLNPGTVRVLIVDDNLAIHEDFYKILKSKTANPALEEIETALFRDQAPPKEEKVEEIEERDYQIDSAYQGQQAVELVQKSIADKNPYSIAFVDVRMPPGIDGVETIKQIWEVDPRIQVVICTAFSDYSWEQFAGKLKNPDSFLILKKPFELIEIRQMISALVKKWELKQQVQYQIDHLQTLVKDRTHDLERSFSLSQATFESIPEGILAVCKDRKIMMYNEALVAMWRLDPNLLKTQDSGDAFRHMADQLEEAHLFIETLYNLSEKPVLGKVSEWKLKSGHILELYTHPQHLHGEVIGCVFSFRDITERQQYEEKLYHQATHDALTGLPNRVLLDDRIQQAIAHGKRYGLYVGVMMFDLDHFKQVNDSLGHNAGDVLLKSVAKKLKSSIRESDTAARLGGDEFVVVLPCLTRDEDLTAKASSFLKAFLTPFVIDDHELTITVSIGISVYPTDGQDPVTLLKNADSALYHAKEMGRNVFQFYISEFNQYTLQRAELITSLRKAVKKNELILHYQPLIDLNSGNIIGVEALLRWDHPTLGTLSPQVFIPLAEEVGLISAIGEWVIKTAFLKIKAWHQSVDPKLHMAINISGYQFRQKDFVQIIKNTLSETGVNPDCIELEMTESVIFKNVPEVSKKMEDLKMLGVHLSIDDFGTGYASFSCLKCFPFDKVKIDKNFIEGINVNSDDNFIVEAIINMAKRMEIKVLAEGVESLEQVEFLRKMQGDEIQGYYFSPPLDAKSCEELLLKKNIPLLQSPA